MPSFTVLEVVPLSLGGMTSVTDEDVRVFVGLAGAGDEEKDRITATTTRPAPRRSSTHKRRCVFKYEVMVIEIIARATDFAMRE